MKFSYASKTPPLIIYKDARKLSYLLLLVTKLSGAVGILFTLCILVGHNNVSFSVAVERWGADVVSGEERTKLMDSTY